MLEATINDLSDRLKKSEESNSNLQTYIEQLKKSYQSVFGNTSSSQSQWIQIPTTYVLCGKQYNVQNTKAVCQQIML